LNASDAGFRDQVIDAAVENAYGDGVNDLCYVLVETGDHVCRDMSHASAPTECIDCVEEFWYGLLLLYSLIFCVGRDVEMYYFWRYWELGNTLDQNKKKTVK
jgi:hypothetical protein